MAVIGFNMKYLIVYITLATINSINRNLIKDSLHLIILCFYTPLSSVMLLFKECERKTSTLPGKKCPTTLKSIIPGFLIKKFFIYIKLYSEKT
jgi:hypothetical protein